MKILKIGFLLSNLLTLTGSVGSRKPIINIIDPGIIVGPIIVDPNPLTDFEITPLGSPGDITNCCYTLSTNTGLSKTVNLNIKIVNSTYPNGITIHSYSGNVEDKTYYFTYNNAYTKSSNSISINVQNTAINETYTASLDLKTGESLNIANKNNKYVSKTKISSYSIFGWLQSAVTYNFKNFDSEYIPTYYHNLDLTNFEITVTNLSWANINYDSANLIINNREGVFNDMPRSGNNIVLPLTIYKKKLNVYKLKFRDVYYVDPTTLMMSSTKKAGYVETNHLYFPRNDMKYQGDYQAMMVFTKFGIDFVRVSYNFKINAQFNILGNCYDSEYCIKNEDADVEENSGWIIE